MNATIRHGIVLFFTLAAACAATAVYAEEPAPGNPHGAFAEDCSICHKADAWKPAIVTKRFDHARYGFALKGAHTILGCKACHATIEFKKAASTCVGCHQDVHRGEFGTDCARCHTSRNFIEHAAELRRHRLTRFPLTGAHIALECAVCHQPTSSGQAQYVNTPVDCESCHINEYNSTKNPDHVASGFSTDCSQCHSTGTWLGAGFNHAAGAFPLTGVHKTVLCDACHPGGRFKGTPTDCYGCHDMDYAGTTNPPHGAARFSTACVSCHNTRAWAPSAFNHGATAFPLTGAHNGQPCLACHGDGIYAGKSTTCVSCHQQNYDNTTNPVHSTAGFPPDCVACHSTKTWQGAVFNHNNTAFPLTGAHTSQPCLACHGDGIYAGKSTTCVSCHQQNYDNTTNPVHSTAGFGPDCKSCHNTNGWAGATFDHDTRFFPIYSGRHNGLWSSCSICHTNAANYSVFFCLSCHPHSDKAGTDSHHSGNRNYVYASSACYSCHPRGRAGN